MSKFSIWALALTFVAIIGSDVALAARRDAREHKQNQRIKQGVKSKELTKSEVRKLRKQQRRIDRVEEKAERNGRVSEREKEKIERLQDKASKDIYRLKHNDRERGDKSKSGVNRPANYEADEETGDSNAAY